MIKLLHMHRSFHPKLWLGKLWTLKFGRFVLSLSCRVLRSSNLQFHLSRVDEIAGVRTFLFKVAQRAVYKLCLWLFIDCDLAELYKIKYRIRTASAASRKTIARSIRQTSRLLRFVYEANIFFQCLYILVVSCHHASVISMQFLCGICLYPSAMRFWLFSIITCAIIVRLRPGFTTTINSFTILSILQAGKLNVVLRYHQKNGKVYNLVFSPS